MTNTITLPIEKLAVSPQNVRRSSSASGMAELKSSIVAHGLMQNLVVTEAAFGLYHVLAGGRRLEAIKQLVAEGTLPEGFMVPCQLTTAEQAEEMSLAENTVREAMHPADEFEAFARLIDAGNSVETVAERFGTTVKHVQQRLKLSRVAPELIQEYRDGTITLDVLMAFTISSDHKQQLKVYKGLSSWQSESPDTIRRLLTESYIDADSKLATFVGIDAYKAAGGTVREDLFGEDIYLEDMELLERLAGEKLEAKAEKLRKEGWSWVEVSADTSYGCFSSHEWIDPNDKEKRQFAGCHVSISYDGKFAVTKGLVKKADKKKLDPEGAKKAAKAKEGSYPDSLNRRLTGHRLEVARLALLDQPDLAADFVAFNLAMQLVPEPEEDDAYYDRYTPQCGIRLQTTRLFTNFGNEVTKNGSVIQERVAALPMAWRKAKNDAERFDQFRALPDSDKKALLAACLALSLHGSLRDEEIEKDEPSAYERLLSLTGVSVADHWRPTGSDFFNRISREQMIAIGNTVAPGWGTGRDKDKKAGLVVNLEKLFADPVAAHYRTHAEAVNAWLPKGMAFVPADSAPAAEETKPKRSKRGKTA